MKCIRCNRELTHEDAVIEIKGFRHCESCFKEVTEHVRERSKATPSFTIPKPAIPLTTGPMLDGYRVVKTLDIVTAECVFGLNFLRDLMAGVTDFLGGRSKTTQNKLREARQICLNELRAEAELLGANAVIAVDLDYSELSGQGKSMLLLVASGTAVVVEKVEQPVLPLSERPVVLDS